MPEQKLRFAVGSATGRRSAIWSLVGQEYDAYVVPIELKGIAKITFHLRTREFSWGYTKEFFEANREHLRHKPLEYGINDAITKRDFERRKLPVAEGGLCLPLRIYVANEALRVDTDLRTVQPIIFVKTRPGRAVGFNLVIVRETEPTVSIINDPDLELVGRMEFTAIAQSIIIAAEHIDAALLTEAGGRYFSNLVAEHPGFQMPNERRLFAQPTVKPDTGSLNLLEIPTTPL